MAGDGHAALDPRPGAAHPDLLAPVAQRDRAGGATCRLQLCAYTRKPTACKNPQTHWQSEERMMGTCWFSGLMGAGQEYD